MSGVISRFVVPDPADLFGSGSVVVDLTLYDGSDDVPAGPAYAHYADIAAGGAVDLFGVGQSPSGALSLRKSGELIADSVTDLQTQADRLRALKGKAGKLFISMGDETSRWTYARCERVSMPRGAEHTLFLPVVLDFTQLDANWRGEHHGGNGGVAWLLDSGEFFDTGRAFDELTGDSVTLTGSGATALPLLNNGNAPVTSVRLLITAGSAPITALEITHATLGIDLLYSASVASAATLIIDSGMRQVTNTGVGDWAHLSRVTPTHFYPGLLVIPPGGATYTVTLTGGGVGSTVVVVYDEAYA